jgi:hypothetical protein
VLGGCVFPGAAGSLRHIFQEAGSLGRDGERGHSGGSTSALEKHVLIVAVVAVAVAVAVVVVARGRIG